MLTETSDDVLGVAFYITGDQELKDKIGRSCLMPKGQTPAGTQELGANNKTIYTYY